MRKRVECDVKDEAAIQRCVDETVATFGTVDILVNNAQEVTLGPLLDMTRDNFDRTAGSRARSRRSAS